MSIQKREKIKVLIVDDAPVLLQGARLLLGSQKRLNVVGAASGGEEAIRQARELSPDVILMDVLMPGIGGLEATWRLRKICPDAKVLLFVGGKQSAPVDFMIQCGAKGAIRKSAPAAELLHAIERIYRGETFFSPDLASASFEECVEREGRAEEPLSEPDRRRRRYRQWMTKLSELKVELIAKGMINVADAEPELPTERARASSTLPLVEKAVRNLSRQELVYFRYWFFTFDAEAWDKQFEQDVAGGRLDALADDAIRDAREGRCKDL